MHSIIICLSKYTVALNKPAYQQNRYTSLSVRFTGASNAVDGLKSNLGVDGGQCTFSEENKQTATWWVNLTKILSNQHIVIYHRTENQEWECKNKTYGQGCVEICGHCRDSKPCHNINGSCMDGCSPGFKGGKCFEECETGFYGTGCLQECSTFCKTSRICHHVSGYCKDGCKSGWQGNDCLEVYKQVVTSTIQQSSFYSVLGLFGISLLLNGVLIAYVIILRKSRKRYKKKNTLEKSTKETRLGQSAKTEPESAVNSGYQELGEFDKSFTTYETLN